ncbi:hypothetical protein CGW93_03685 [candidate division bacterium WOR-3 4484_18]|uniref:Uncharacterized protein n=1 Tax=candidate division WOR-3 bacterium 4484_18 TaxID=2020626 RepID=A0A257LTK1_UNCW3|nr:MAG: hypothetical protein CGW93_03685 [candidate division bacterium WOR-3 4484_18]
MKSGRNYYDPLVDKTFEYKVVHVGPRVLNEENEILSVEFKLYGQFDHPTVIVDGIPACNTTYMDMVDEVIDTLKADRLLYNVVNTSIGITITRKIYAFSNQYHDNYFIYDYVFKNTGIYDKEGHRHEQTLQDVVIFFQYRYSPCRETGPYGYYWMPQNTSWGRNTVNDVIGQREPGDTFRAIFAWKGKHSAWNAPGDCIGEPNIGSEYVAADGRLGAPQFCGVVVIHADKSPHDTTDDVYQPTTTWYIDSDHPRNSGNDQFNEEHMEEEYELMTRGHAPKTHAEEVGDGNADEFGNTAGGYSATQGFGPYTLEPGDSIHIVLAEAVAGLNRKSACEIGALWYKWAYEGYTGPFELPDGSTTNDGNEYKNAWVFTGKDSLFETFRRAIANYKAGFNIPQPPPPPDMFMTNEPAFLRRPPGVSLEDIRVVPNPYNIRARELQYGAGGPDRIMFLNIPPFCTIRIYTERGDLIKTIIHDDGSGDEAWESVTSSRQLVVSGVYIAHFEVTQDYYDPNTGELLYRKGEQTIRKFIIIR